MVMFSQLRRCSITDEQGGRTRLLDLSVALLEADYPPVTSLIFLKQKSQKHFLPWSAVQSFKPEDCQIQVENLKVSKPLRQSSLGKDVLLRDHIQDALVLDLQNRRVTRANDLWLETHDERLELRAADTGFQSMIRRLSGGRYGRMSESSRYDWKYVEFLRGDPEAVRNGEGYHLRIGRLPGGEIGRLTDMLPYLHAAELITLLPDAKAVQALQALSPERQLQVFEELKEDQALALLTLMAPDIAADLLGRLPTKLMRFYLEKLPEKQSERVLELLRYPEDTVGGIMTNDVIYLRGNLPVAKALEVLRESLKEPDFVFLIYIVDNDKSRRLRGLLSLRNLLTSKADQKLEDIMDPYLTTLDPLSPAREGAYRVIDSHVAALPVINKEGRLLGIVTVDAAIAQVAPPEWRTQAPRIFS
jgi:CBS domain-containing protein